VRHPIAGGPMAPRTVGRVFMRMERLRSSPPRWLSLPRRPPCPVAAAVMMVFALAGAVGVLGPAAGAAVAIAVAGAAVLAATTRSPAAAGQRSRAGRSRSLRRRCSRAASPTRRGRADRPCRLRGSGGDAGPRRALREGGRKGRWGESVFSGTTTTRRSSSASSLSPHT